MNVAFLCLGGNTGNRSETLALAIQALQAAGCRLRAASRVYETAAWGSNSGNNFLNQVICVETLLGAERLMQVLLEVEAGMGRKREANRNADRSIDIDILFFNSEVIDTDQLQVPHPRLHLRRFVLVPLAELAGRFRHPTLGRTVQELLQECKDELEVTVFQPGASSW